MNDTAHVVFDEFSRSASKLELGLKFVEILKKAVVSDLAPRCKRLQFASQLNDVRCYTDPFMAGDQPETVLAVLERRKEEIIMEDDDEPSKTESISERTGIRSDVFSADEASISEITEDHSKTEEFSQRLVREEDAWQAIKRCADLPRKRSELLRLINQDLLVADLKVSLFITACNNVRVKPFPTHIVDETPDGLLGLSLVNNQIPPIDVLKYLLEKDKTQPNENVVNVMHWLMVQLRQPKLLTLPRDNFDSVFERVQYAVNLQCPNFIVKIMVNNLSSNYLQWQAAKGQLSTRYAFYGARVEHIHSLVHLGLYPFQKVSGPLGKGIYLTTDLQSCLDSSPPSWVWGKSVIGTQLQTIAVVEFVDRHSKVVAYRDRQIAHQPGQGKPFNYYIPKTNLIQARYLLIFVKDSHRPRIRLDRSNRKNLNKILIGSAFVGSYLALCYVAWKSIRSTNVSFWGRLVDTYKDVQFLNKLPHFYPTE